jgi:hypothetical protein
MPAACGDDIKSFPDKELEKYFSACWINITFDVVLTVAVLEAAEIKSISFHQKEILFHSMIWQM